MDKSKKTIQIADEGIEHFEEINILKISHFSLIGSPVEIIAEFGGREQYFQVVELLEREIYS